MAPLLALTVIVFFPSHPPTNARPVHPPVVANRAPAPRRAADVWAVEENARYDLYSNGLRIENEFAVSNEPRISYPVYGPKSAGTETADRPVEWRSGPVGLVYHSTESHQAAFEPAQVRSLKRIGRNLLEYVRSQRAYHFVVDRFGRVYRIVRETDGANHAGRSVWSDVHGVYVNLNSSFLAVALEAQSDASHPPGEAQLHAARILTDMLRSRYGIPATNCVTHAQVSVNPLNMRIGYHTDWASGFPFAQIGLPDNYAQQVPSVSIFGFDYDDVFLDAAGGQPWQGLLAADRFITEQAGAARLSPRQFRVRLQQRYRRIIHAQALKIEENQDDI